MASTITTRLAPASSATDWTLANNRAQERIIQLQEQRAREASSNSGIARLRNLFTTTSRPAFRVGQLDTELLDEELLELLKGQLWGGLKYFRPSIKETYEPELLLLLRAALFKLTIWDHNASYGAALQNLRYTDARRHGPIDHPPSKGQKSLYGLITVGGRYLHQRLNLFLLSRSEGNSFPAKLSRLLDTVGSIHSALTLLSFTAFLVTGHYRTILDRVLRMRLVTPNRTVAREVSFEYLNRQLVWHAFTEFLLFILPLLRIGRWRRWWARFLRRVRSENGAAGETTGELAFLPERTCAICYKETDAESAGAALGGGRATDITNPYEAVECGHAYCYVCLAGKIELEEGEGWTCLRCGELVKRCRPWRGGLEGLTGVGDWGEEVYGEHQHTKGGYDREDEDGSVVNGMMESDLLDELQDGDVEDDESEIDGVERQYEDDAEEEGGGHRSDAGSEDTVQPTQNGHVSREESSQWPIDYTDDSVFDDSQYNTAEDYD
ncbi:Pex12 amino terminal region-domain-containing protein [Sphaerosporella brunnea]|uniref:RING-type E3 ubiquitin transferase (cysteine targeting) n=1 Tax=Sphaerosporella brunnea TaxID=1250544 RepID=A0A5J5F598_9PEZI|nr:Pex12 amino terminal region-domain-containing protein [Sphaerosporella brunnea]